MSAKLAQLSIEIEQKDTGDRWTNTYAPSKIEEITHATGNFKPYATFIEMLLSALKGDSNSEFLDILRYNWV